MGEEYSITVLDAGDPVVIADRILAAGGTWTGQYTETTLVYSVRDGRVVELVDGSDGHAVLKVIDTAGGTTRSVVTTVDSFAAGRAVLDRLDLPAPRRRECVRTTFTLHAASVSIDRWPGLPPLLQLSADHPSGLLAAAGILGYPASRTSPLTVAEAYSRFGVDLDAHAEVSFTVAPRSTPRPRPVTGPAGQVRVVPVTDDGRLLLIRRTRPGRPVYWQYPGATRQGRDEPLEDLAVRAVTAQTGGAPTLLGCAGLVEATGVPVAVYVAGVAGWDPAARTTPPADDPDRATYQLDPVDLHPATLRVLDIWPAPVTDLLLAAATGADGMVEAVRRLAHHAGDEPAGVQ